MEEECLTLRISKGIPQLLLAELAVLQTRTVLSHSLNHQSLVLFAEAVCLHWRVRHPPANKGSPENRYDTIGNEESLPGLERGSLWNMRETESEETADNLVYTVHHEPVRRLTMALRTHAEKGNGHKPKCDSSSLFFTSIPHA